MSGSDVDSKELIIVELHSPCCIPLNFYSFFSTTNSSYTYFRHLPEFLPFFPSGYMCNISPLKNHSSVGTTTQDEHNIINLLCVHTYCYVSLSLSLSLYRVIT